MSVGYGESFGWMIVTVDGGASDASGIIWDDLAVAQRVLRRKVALGRECFLTKVVRVNEADGS